MGVLDWFRKDRTADPPATLSASVLEMAGSFSKATRIAPPEDASTPHVSFYNVPAQEGSKIPIGYRWFMQYLWLYLESDTVRTVIDALRREILRSGLHLRQEYASKCPVCGKEFDVYTPVCDECGSPTIRPPESGRRLLRKWIKGEPVNDSGESIYDILEQVELDLEIFDNAYILVEYKYDVDDDGNIVRRNPFGIRVIRPIYVAKIVDDNGRMGYDHEGYVHYVCPVHRDHTVRVRPGDPVPKCDKCGLKMIKAGYVIAVQPYGIPAPPVKKTIYGVDEIIHVVKYFPNDLYGVSPLYSVRRKVLTLIFMDEYLLKYFDKELPPKGLLILPNISPEELDRVLMRLNEQMRRNPHMIPVISVSLDASSGSKKLAEFINLGRDLREITLIDARNEFRRQIGAIYGVTGMFLGDTQTGGWNNQGMQVIVSNRAVMYGQKVLEDKVLTPLIRRFGVRGWKLTLEPPENREKLAELDYLSRLADVLGKYKAMGFEVELDREFNYKIYKKPVDAESSTDTSDLRTPEEREADRSDERVRSVSDFLERRVDGGSPDRVTDLTGSPAPRRGGEFKGVRPEDVGEIRG